MAGNYGNVLHVTDRGDMIATDLRNAVHVMEPEKNVLNL
ncbi:hypothetical protein phi5_83 [Enterobacter phage phi5]|nr:hypothetical protein phi5_83 [Enterobacter phage phi5]